MSLKYTLERLRWIKVLWSPFKPFNIRWYVGKLAIGTPYFFPRKWVKATNRRATLATLNEIEGQKKWNELNPQYPRKIKSFEEIFQANMKCRYPVPLKVGFDWCSLGYKTKWTNTDFRYEWGPVFTFVFFGYQIAMMIGHKHPSHYWECWLYYEYATDKTKSKRERVEQCRKEFPQTWTVFSQGKEEVVDYYEHILKPKYLK
jgi:hypothetical protein